MPLNIHAVILWKGTKVNDLRPRNCSLNCFTWLHQCGNALNSSGLCQVGSSQCEGFAFDHCSREATRGAWQTWNYPHDAARVGLLEPLLFQPRMGQRERGSSGYIRHCLPRAVMVSPRCCSIYGPYLGQASISLCDEKLRTGCQLRDNYRFTDGS